VKAETTFIFLGLKYKLILSITINCTVHKCFDIVPRERECDKYVIVKEMGGYYAKKISLRNVRILNQIFWDTLSNLPTPPATDDLRCWKNDLISMVADIFDKQN